MASLTFRPEKLTGGCLCGAIRYTIDITPETEWPPVNNGSCQCTSCRKFTGALLHRSCTFPTTSVTPPLTTNPPYTLYASSKIGLRGFCRICGSSLSFSRPGSSTFEILLGTIDEEILKSDTGTQLCLGKGHIFCHNEVKGVTDALPGTSWGEDRDGDILRKLAEK